MKKIIFTIALSVISAAACLAQNPVGKWEGTADIMGESMRINFDIAQTDDGLKGSMQSPDQSDVWIPFYEVDFENGKIEMSIPMIGFVYTGEVLGHRMEGQFEQSGYIFTLNLIKTDE